MGMADVNSTIPRTPKDMSSKQPMVSTGIFMNFT